MTLPAENMPTEGIMHNYQWPGPFTPYKHQIETSEFIVKNRRGFVLNDMGVGKSASALWSIDQLMTQGTVNRTLIVAPLSTINRVWRDEAFRLLMHRNTVVLHGSADRRRKLYQGDHWDIGIINFDGIGVLHKDILEDVKSGRINMIVVDEASAYRNTQTERFKRFHAIVRHCPRLILMTGTPCPEAPTDAFGLAKLIDSPLVPKFFGAWRRQTMYQVSQFQWKPKPDGFAHAFSILQPAVRFRKEDCIDLPPLTFEEWDVQLSKEQIRAYKDMTKRMAVEFAEVGDGLSAVNAADKINKLRQIACGVVRDTETGEYLLLEHKQRTDATLAAIEQAAAKVIVVVPFKGIIQHLSSEISKHYSTAVINGDVSSKARDEIVTRFRETTDPHVLLVHPKVMAHGLTLVEADVMVFYAPIYSNEETRQIIERIRRPGQKRSMTVIRLGATDLEWGIYRATEEKAKGESMLLDMYKAAMKESV